MIKSRAKVKAMAHQIKSIKHDADNPVVLDLSDAGTGKGFVRIVTYAERRSQGAGCMLVLAPRSLLRSVWFNDFKKFAPQLKVVVATASSREEAFSEEADVYVTNHDAVKWLVNKKPIFWKKFSELVVDESPAFKHHTSQRAKALVKISKHFSHRKMLTATPTSNGICDIWNQVFILDEGKRLGPSYFSFRNSVCEAQQVGRVAHAVRWTDKVGAEEAVYGLLNDIVVRHRRDECLDIPATHIYTIPYEMTAKQQKAYDDLEQHQLLPLIDQIGKAKQAQIVAINAAAVMTKLLQVSSGAVYDGSGEYAVIDLSRYEMIMDLVEARKHPIVFFLWQHQCDLLTKEAEKRGLNFAVIDGTVGDNERHAIVHSYQQGKYDVLFAHPQTAAHGLTLTRGTSTIWASPTYNLEWFIQGNSRQARIGQTEKTEVITVLAEGSRELEIYNQILIPKGERMSNLLDLVVQGTKELV